MSEARKDLYDFNKLEDMFEAIDTLTRATAVLAPVDEQLAADLVKMTNTLIELSQNDPQQVSAEPRAEQEVMENNVELDDLTTVAPKKQKNSFNQDEGEIIDVLTGQPVSK